MVHLQKERAYLWRLIIAAHVAISTVVEKYHLVIVYAGLLAQRWEVQSTLVSWINLSEIHKLT